MFSGTLNIKLCEFGESADGLIYVYDDKLGFRFAIHSVQKRIGNHLLGFHSQESVDNLCSLLLTFMLWLIMSWASF